MDTTIRRCAFIVQGQVQGVGFRPCVFRLAQSLTLTGSVCNTAQGVRIEVQGTQAALDAFATVLPTDLPPLARITRMEREEIAPLPQEQGFHIIASEEHEHGGHAVLISPDVGLCEKCHADILNSQNRRYHYPFTNCTDCGPRYSITHSIPYDRATTSMACFPQCAACQAEYENPYNRRFHAQPNACPDCGPVVWTALPQPEGMPLDSCAPPTRRPTALETDAPFVRVAETLLQGKVAAIKGLGGFHLACDAANSEAVALLRARKARPHKPLAVMVRDVDAAREVAHINEAAASLLLSPARPIVLCPRKEVLPAILAYDTPHIGIVLPYTPLHVVLFEVCAAIFPAQRPLALVMTSGNAGGEPICLGNREALERLRHLADIFLLHNRDILIRVDDSVLGLPDSPSQTAGEVSLTAQADTLPLPTSTADSETVAPAVQVPLTAQAGTLPPPCAPEVPFLPPTQPIFYRRARGYVPTPVDLPQAGPSVLGAGAELKNTLCLTRGAQAFVSQHIGDVQNMETSLFHAAVAEHLQKLLECRPQLVVCDLHPDFASTRFAETLAAERNIPLLRLQHHFAHGWSVLAEHCHSEPALVLSLDGTGLGEDNTIWGGEVLCIHPHTLEHHRLGRLRPFPLVGGEAAIREPWRIAVALSALCGLALPPLWHEDGLPPTTAAQAPVYTPRRLPKSYAQGYGQPFAPTRTQGYAPDATELATVLHMTQKNIRCVPTSSAGRLFDAVGALLGLCLRTSYEGQAAIRLETAQGPLASQSTSTPYAVDCTRQGDLWEWDSHALFAAVAQDYYAAGTPLPVVARRFHHSLAQGFALMAAKAAQELGLRTVALSGGALQNMTLLPLLCRALHRHGLTPLLPKAMPAHDGGLSLGQAAWGQAQARLLNI